jgi:propionate CoA-transferase
MSKGSSAAPRPAVSRLAPPLYDGGGLDIAFLSFAQVGPDGSVNVSRFGNRIIGVGGFMNISQNAKRVVFSGTFTAGGLDIAWPEGCTTIAREGKHPKFVARLDQLTYNATCGRERGQPMTYVTERAVFRSGPEGLELAEIAPGVDLERDILAHMAFRPHIAGDVREMDARLFRPEPMGLAVDLAARPRLSPSPRVRAAWEALDG